MFDFAWTEIALIGIVALIAIGPKDMPVAIKAVAEMIKKARKMAGEFQTHVDEMVREANLDEVRSQITQIRNLDIKGTIERAVDNDGSLRRTFREDPLKDAFKPAPAAPTIIAGTSTAETVLADAQATPDLPPAAAGGEAGTTAAAEPVEAAPPAVAHAMPEAPIGSRVMERPSFMDAASGEVPEPEPAPAFIPPAIATPPVPPAFIPPGVPRATPPSAARPRF